MTGAWVVYAMAVGALLSAAAMALEAILRGRAPTRWIWTCVLAASVGIPVLGLLSAGRGDMQPGVGLPADPVVAVLPPDVGATGANSGFAAHQEVRPEGRAGPSPASFAIALPGLSVPWGRLPRASDPLPVWAKALWGLLSGFGVLWMAWATATLRRRRSGWQRSSVRGREILVSEDAGPAVVGVWRSELVLPRWCLDLEASDLELLLRHEEEHRRARDLPLVAAGLALSVAFPWNPGLWFQLRRLRLAVEIDCDRRVLGASTDLRRYGSLLLDLGDRGRQRGVGTALAFARPMPFLERRIRVMTRSRAFHPFRSLVLSSVAGVLAVAACRMESPPTPQPVASAPAMPVPRPESGARSGLDPGTAVRLQEARPPEPMPMPEPEPDVRAPATEARERAPEAPQPVQEAQELGELARALEALQAESWSWSEELQGIMEQIEEGAEAVQALPLEDLATRLDQQQVQLADALTRAREAVRSLHLLELEQFSREMRGVRDRERRSRLDSIAREFVGRRELVSDSIMSELVRKRRLLSDSILAGLVQRRKLVSDSVAIELARRGDVLTDSAVAELARQRAVLSEAMRIGLVRQRALLNEARASAEAGVAADRLGEEIFGRRGLMDRPGRIVVSAREGISGRVLSPDGSTPLSGVSVTAPEFEVGTLTVGGIPDGTGRFMLRGVRPGLHVLVFEHPEYGRWEVEVEVLEGKNTVLGDVIAPGD